ncbi:MAG: hypothetical protein JW769_01910 [Parachlamydiales bacterium]|nr:hypothetical protein [Parachlamydiales bacterium]
MDVIPFRKHLEDSFPNNLSFSYLVVNPHAYERRKIVEEIVCYLPHKSTYGISYFYAGKDSIGAVKEELCSPSLLGGDPLVVVDDIDVLNFQEMRQLAEIISTLHAFLIMGASSSKPIRDIYNAVEKRGLVLDLMYEKPWDREKRFLDFMTSISVRYKKTISQDVQKIFLEKVGMNLSSVEKELEKLLTFAGGRDEVTIDDVMKVAISCEEHTFWQIADSILWQEDPWINYSIPSNDLTFFHNLVPALRYQLEFGYKIASLYERGYKIADFQNEFPRMSPKIFSYKQMIAQKRGTLFYKKILQVLFRLDLQSKSGVDLPEILIHLFQAEVAYALQRNRPITQSSR